MINLENLKIGADPELFAFDEDTKNFMSVHNVLQGTKDQPFPVNRGAVQVDGTAAEFNIEPVSCREDFLTNITTVQHQLQQILPNSYHLQAVPVATFQKDYFDKLPEECKLLGCDPDFNAWNHGQQNPDPEATDAQRVAGGHVHLGWTEDKDIHDPAHTAISMHLIRQLDFLLGLSSLSWDTDTIRRKTYGRAGAYRIKPYGVEYRTLSNAWLKHSDTILKVYDLSVAAVKAATEDIWFEDRFGPVAEEIINKSNTKEAEAILSTIREEFDIAV